MVYTNGTESAAAGRYMRKNPYNTEIPGSSPGQYSKLPTSPALISVSSCIKNVKKIIINNKDPSGAHYFLCLKYGST